jgi:mannose-1-phosphate guanylyltransferase
MFLFAASAWLRELAQHAPELFAACEAIAARLAVRDGVVRLDAEFAGCPANSVDYAVMEHTDRAAVVPLAAGWSDVGSWASVHDALSKDAAGNATVGDVLLEGCRNTYVAAHGKLVAAVGLEGVVVVVTDDAVLVVAREHAESVKQIAEQVAKRRAKL